MGVFDDLEENNGKVEATTKAWLGQRFAALEQPFDTLFKLFGAAEARQRTQFPDGPFQAALLYSRIAQHLWVTWRLILTGHYLDAINTLKIVNESTLLAHYLARDGEAASEWEHGKKGFRPVDVRAALTKLLAKDEAQAKPLTKELNDSYALVCKVAHPNPASIEWIRGGLTTFHTTSRFEEQRCAAAMVRLIDELALVIPGLTRIVMDAGSDVPREHIADLLGVLSRIRATFQAPRDLRVPVRSSP